MASAVAPAASAGTAVAARGKKKLNLFYTPLHDRNIGSFKLLLETVLPVRYPEDVYKQLLKTPYEYTKLAYFDDIFVGTVACRVEGEGSAKKLYIMMLAVLAPYRGRGIGTEMMRVVMENVAKDADIKEVYMHVHTGNEEAQAFYGKLGFEKGALVPGYYRGITPPDAHLFSKKVNAAAAAASAAASAGTAGEAAPAAAAGTAAATA